MEIKEEKRNLFDVNFKEYTVAHCISADCKMGAGIALPIKKKFSLNGMMVEKDSPHCHYHNGVLNLVTKKKYFHKPTYDSMRKSLESMKEIVIENDIEKVVMPKIGSGLDKLSWPKVREIIEETFEDVDLEILVCKI